MCACNRKLHKDEIRRQREKALNNGIDSDSGSDMEIDSGFSVPGRIWNKLYRCAELFAAAVVLFDSLMQCRMKSLNYMFPLCVC